MIDISNTISIGSRDKGINWSSYWTQLLTEAEDNLTTEEGDLLLAEQNITE